MLKKDLEREIKILNMQLDQALKDYDEETNKTAKAIKYINEELYEVGGNVHGSDLPYDCISDLLNILQGL